MTIWGKALYAALSDLNPADHLEEPVLIAIELLRLGLFKTNPVSLYTINGAPIRGSGWSPSMMGSTMMIDARAYPC